MGSGHNLDLSMSTSPNDEEHHHKPHQEKPQPEHNSGFIPAVALLCIASLANGLIIVSIFPYAGYLVLKVLPNTTPESVGAYAGWIAASFMAGRFGTAYLWGRLADTYGRVAVLKSSLWLSAVFCIWFGVSTTFVGAIGSRFALGMANAITSTTKVLASEVARGDTTKERQAMGLTVGMRSYGFLLGPALGGLLADPLLQYPAWFVVPENAQQPHYNFYLHAHSFLSTYPFVLPNLVIALICLGAAVACPIFLTETLEDKQTFSIAGLFTILWDELVTTIRGITTCCLRRGGTLTKEEQRSLLVSNTNTVEEPSVWSRNNTRQHMIFTWLFSFVVTVIDEAFPLFCISTVGGLGLTEASIGQILSLAGLIFALLQYLVYIQTVQRWGLYPSIELGCFVGLIPLSLIPVSLALQSGYENQSWTFGAFLAVLLGACKIFTCMCFASLAIATNKTAPTSQRARMNGLVLLGGSVAKGLGPIFAGLLVAASFSNLSYPFGAILIFGTIGALGAVSFFVSRTLKKFASHEG